MCIRLFAATCLLLVLVMPTASLAQNRSTLVGTWERISLKNAQGEVTQPPGPAAFVIFSAEGYFSQTSFPIGRAKLDKPLNQMTKEELLNRFQGVEARRGAYTVAGNKLTRKNVASGNPVQEGMEQVQDFRIEGDILVLTTPGNKAEARFRRLK